MPYKLEIHLLPHESFGACWLFAKGSKAIGFSISSKVFLHLCSDCFSENKQKLFIDYFMYALNLSIMCPSSW